MCTHPVQLDDNLIVPCGRCVNCKIAHTREWSVRVLHEVCLHDFNVFVTLTFSDDYLPSSLSLSKVDIQLFIKRLRKRLKKSLKYLCVGEYGECKGTRLINPHYHGLLFGVGPFNKKDIEAAWPFGMIYVGDVTPQSTRYCLEYIQKQFTPDFAKKIYGNRVQPFMLVSKGLGKKFVEENEKVIRENLGIMLHGKNVGLPRYYKNILELTDEEKNVIHLESAMKTKERYIDATLSPENAFEDFKKKKYQLQQNLIARSQTRERKL